MTIEKLPSGHYRVKQYYNGKRYATTIDHKPSTKEAAEIVAELLKDATDQKGSFKEYALKYIELKEHILSPRTVREYALLVERFPGWFLKMQLSDIDQEKVQRLVNELSISKSPKTIRTYHGFVTAILGLYRPSLTLRTTLPMKIKKEPYIPTVEDVRAMFEYAKDTQYHVALQLGCMGLRRSEICALQITDLSDDDVIHVNKAMVQNKDGNWVIKGTKTTESARDVPISHDLAEEIRAQGYVFNGYPGTISNFLAREQKKHNLPQFSLHKMRHFFASQLMDMGVNQKDIMELGGWKSDSANSVMKTIYQHSVKAKTEEGRRIISDNLTQRIFSP